MKTSTEQRVIVGLVDANRQKDATHLVREFLEDGWLVRQVSITGDSGMVGLAFLLEREKAPEPSVYEQRGLVGV